MSCSNTFGLVVFLSDDRCCLNMLRCAGRVRSGTPQLVSCPESALIRAIFSAKLLGSRNGRDIAGLRATYPLDPGGSTRSRSVGCKQVCVFSCQRDDRRETKPLDGGPLRGLHTRFLMGRSCCSSIWYHRKTQ